MDWLPVNWTLLRNPLNWAIIILMVLIGAMGVDIVLSAVVSPHSNGPAGDAGTPSTGYGY